MLSGLLLAVSLASPPAPIALHPENPRYFLFRGKPTILVTSAEHYGAVLNPDFPFKPYLDELRSRKFNYTRIFSGSYCEDPRSFNIRNNTLAPAPGRFLSPWARSEKPGYANGGNKFDLSKWDAQYFQRLKQFLTEAGRRGIVVELSLFCPFYDDSMWNLSPLNARNNVNGVGTCGREEVYALKHPDLTGAQDALTRKLAEELSGFDNLFFEICNEPYFGGVTLAAAYCGDHRGGRARHRRPSPDRPEHRERVRHGRRSRPCGLDLQLPLRLAARCRGSELQPEGRYRF
jgi:hypothetical protein